MEDALLFASMLMSFVRHSDRVKVACQSLLTNISAAIMTEKGGEVWVQPIYYPFAYMSKYARGIVLEEVADGPVYDCEQIKNIPYVDSVVVYNEEKEEIVLFAVNRREDMQEVSLELQGFSPESIVEHAVMTSPDRKDTNLENHEKVKPYVLDDVSIGEKTVTFQAKPLSWNMVRIKLK